VKKCPVKTHIGLRTGSHQTVETCRAVKKCPVKTHIGLSTGSHQTVETCRAMKKCPVKTHIGLSTGSHQTVETCRAVKKCPVKTHIGLSTGSHQTVETCRAVKKCPVKSCAAVVIHLPRHLRHRHGWKAHDARAAVMKFRLRKPYSSMKARKVRDYHKPRQCPVDNCGAVVKRLSSHIRTHGIKNDSTFYGEILAKAKHVSDCSQDTEAMLVSDFEVPEITTLQSSDVTSEKNGQSQVQCTETLSSSASHENNAQASHTFIVF